MLHCIYISMLWYVFIYVVVCIYNVNVYRRWLLLSCHASRKAIRLYLPLFLHKSLDEFVPKSAQARKFTFFVVRAIVVSNVGKRAVTIG